MPTAANIATGTENLIASGNIHIINKIIKIIEEKIAAENTSIVWQTVFKIGLITPGLGLAQIRISFKCVLLIITAIDTGGKVRETELYNVFFSGGPKLDRRRDIKTVIELGSKKCKVP